MPIAVRSNCCSLPWSSSTAMPNAKAAMLPRNWRGLQPLPCFNESPIKCPGPGYLITDSLITAGGPSRSHDVRTRNCQYALRAAPVLEFPTGPNSGETRNVIFQARPVRSFAGNHRGLRPVVATVRTSFPDRGATRACAIAGQIRLASRDRVPGATSGHRRSARDCKSSRIGERLRQNAKMGDQKNAGRVDLCIGTSRRFDHRMKSSRKVTCWPWVFGSLA